ncbi:MAG: hypothetical protein KGL35_20725 [Bradyrhizobium sp.]|nr:hypothetical protein [Bradyrhizobium sp.]
MPVPPIPVDPAYAVQPGGVTPGYAGMSGPPMATPFQGGMGGLIPPMPSINYGQSGPYGPAATGTQVMQPQPLGGYWNQMAQQMAGPMFMPPTPQGIPFPKLTMPGTPTTVAPPTSNTPQPPTTPPTLNPIPRLVPIGGGGGGIGGGGFGGGGGIGLRGNPMLGPLRLQQF